MMAGYLERKTDETTAVGMVCEKAATWDTSKVAKMAELMVASTESEMVFRPELEKGAN